MIKLFKKIPFVIRFSAVFLFCLIVIFYAGSFIENNILHIHSDMGTPTAWVMLIFIIPLTIFLKIIGFNIFLSGKLFFPIVVLYIFILGLVLGLMIQFIKKLFKR
jgi:hypothetical protein